MIDIKQPSTQRGIIWIIASLIGGIGWMIGKDIQPIITLAMAVAGGMGLKNDDQANTDQPDK